MVKTKRVRRGLNIEVNAFPALASLRRTGTQVLSGFSALMVLPSGRYTSPSAWNPGQDWLKPRSITSSTSLPRASAGTVPVTWIQLVPQAGPHCWPTAKGW